MTKKKRISRKLKSRIKYPTPSIKNLIQESAFCKGTEYFRHRDVILYQGDALDEYLFNREFIDLPITSPPYNVGIKHNSTKDKPIYKNYLRRTKKNNFTKG